MSADPPQQRAYRDFLFEDLTKVKNEIKIADGNRKGPRGGVVSPFPSKLYGLIEDAQSDGLCHIISWQVHGRCFKIHNFDFFAAYLLPRYFRQTKFSSFKRQMNLYGFRRELGADNGSYYHELFLRGRPDLVMTMRRVGAGVSDGWRPYQGEEDPNFYAYPFCPELTPGANVVSDGSEQSSNDSTEGTIFEQLPTVCPDHVIFRRRFEFPGPQLSSPTTPLGTETEDDLSFADVFDADIMVVTDEMEEFESSAVERMLAHEEDAFHQNFF